MSDFKTEQTIEKHTPEQSPNKPQGRLVYDEGITDTVPQGNQHLKIAHEIRGGTPSSDQGSSRQAGSSRLKNDKARFLDNDHAQTPGDYEGQRQMDPASIPINHDKTSGGDSIYKNFSDARRGGTAPEGASRKRNLAGGQQQKNTNPVFVINKMNLNYDGGSYQQNPYGMPIGPSSNPRKKKFANDSVIMESMGSAMGNSAKSNNGHQASQGVKDHNQIIARIYGKSNKFVMSHESGKRMAKAVNNVQSPPRPQEAGGQLPSKKTRVQNMKEILRQKTGQQQRQIQTSEGGPRQMALKNIQNNSAQGQAKKIRVDKTLAQKFTAPKKKAESETNFQGDRKEESKKSSQPAFENNQPNNRNSSLQFQAESSQKTTEPLDKSFEMASIPDSQRFKDKSFREKPEKKTEPVHRGNSDMGVQQNKRSEMNLRTENKPVPNSEKKKEEPSLPTQKPTIQTTQEMQDQQAEWEIDNLYGLVEGSTENLHQPEMQRVTEGSLSNLSPSKVQLNSGSKAKHQDKKNGQLGNSQSSNNQFQVKSFQDGRPIKAVPLGSNQKNKALSKSGGRLEEDSNDAEDEISLNQSRRKQEEAFAENNSFSWMQQTQDVQTSRVIQEVEQPKVENGAEPYALYAAANNVQFSSTKGMKNEADLLKEEKEEGQPVVIPQQFFIPQERPQERSQQTRHPNQVSISSVANNRNPQKSGHVNLQGGGIKKIAKIKGKLHSQFQIDDNPAFGKTQNFINTIDGGSMPKENEYSILKNSNSNPAGTGSAVTHQQYCRTLETSSLQQKQNSSSAQNGVVISHNKTTSNLEGGPPPPKKLAAEENSCEEKEEVLMKKFGQPQPIPLIISNHDMPLQKNDEDMKNLGQTNSFHNFQNAQQNQSQLLGTAPSQLHSTTLGYQFEQWQRPPSRQKEPNQALGLDDTRPRTRGGANSLGGTGVINIQHNQFFSGYPPAPAPHISGRDRKRNIQKLIPSSQIGVLSMSNMYQGNPGEMPSSTVNAGRNNRQQANSNRPRVIDFFHQRNNNINGFNLTGDQSQNIPNIQNQFNHIQPKSQQLFQNTFEDRSDYPLVSRGDAQGSNQAQSQQNMVNPRRGNFQDRPEGNAQRPPSRHKDPSQNLGLELYPPNKVMGFPNEFGGYTPHNNFPNKQYHQGSLAGAGLGFDADSEDIEAVGIDSDTGIDNQFEIDLDNAGYFWGHSNKPNHPNMPSKQFKEDEEDFFETQYQGKPDDDKTDLEAHKIEKGSKKKASKGIKFSRQPSESAANSKSQLIKQGNPRGGNGSYSGGHGSHQSFGGQTNFQQPPFNMLSQQIPSQQFSQTYGYGMSGGQMVDGPNNQEEQQMQQQQYHQNMQQNQSPTRQMEQIAAILSEETSMRNKPNFEVTPKDSNPKGKNQENDPSKGTQVLFNSNFYIGIFGKNNIQLKPDGGCSSALNPQAAMNQMIPPGEMNNNEVFNMSANIPQMVQHSVNAGGQAKRVVSTAKAGSQQANAAGFHSTGYNNNGNQMGDFKDDQQLFSSSQPSNNYQGYLNPQQEFLQRGFKKQRSPVNDRTMTGPGGIQQLMQNPQLKHINKPKSATGHRISGKQNRFKNLNNSGRFIGQNSTIIHSAYNNQNIQQLRMYQKPIAGGWMEQGSTHGEGTNSGGPNQSDGIAGSSQQQFQNSKVSKSQVSSTVIKQHNLISHESKAKKGSQSIISAKNIQEDLGKKNQSVTRIQGMEGIADEKMQERIKIGQEINLNRPKESKGHRSTEKRHINNQSLGVVNSGGGMLQADNSGAIHTRALQANPLKNMSGGNYVSSPQSCGVMTNQGNTLYNQNFMNTHNPMGHQKGGGKQSEVFSQTGKFSKNGNRGLDTQGSKAGGDKTDLADFNSMSGKQGFAGTNQNSFKSQTLQFPNSINSQLGDDFINLFAN